MHTFADYTSSLTLIPGAGGQFEVVVNGETLFSKKAKGRYPELKELRDAISKKLA